MNIEVTKGFKISQVFAVTAYPFAVGSQKGTQGVRPLAWDDLLHTPSLFISVVIIPVFVAYLAIKAVK
jgi:hypothetical protein